MTPFISGSPPRRRLMLDRMPRQIQAVVLTVLAVALACTGVFAVNQTAHAATTLLSQGQPTTASSSESAAYPAADATDGNTNTRWSSAFSDPQWLQVDLGATATISSVTLQWEAAYATAFQIQTSNDATTWTTIYSTTTGTGGTQNLTVSGTGRYVRMYGTARATGYGYSLWEFQVYGTLGTSGPTCGTTDAALNQPTTASSLESAAYPAADATDGNVNTRWSSAYSDPQWLEVDLGSTQSICGVSLDWEAAYATAFQIQTSNDNATWTTIYSTTTGTGGTQNLTVSGSGRYIRMYGTARATGYGYSLWEFDVYTGSGGGSSGPSPSPSSSSPPVTWTPVWSDNFAGASGTAPSSADWIEDTGTSAPGGPANWGTGEVETMSGSTGNVHLDGSNHLDITALDSGGAWTSGRIESQRSDFAAPAGGMLQISASIEQPNPANGVGYWPAFWTLGAGDRTGGTWPAVGETDIMEDVNGRSETSGTLHCGVAPGGPCNEFTGRTSGMTACPGCQTGYHTYSEVIDRSQANEQIRWYLDGTEIWSVSESQVGTATWQAAVDHGFFIIFDLAIGGSFPNADCGCTSPNAATSSGGTMSIASVSVQQATGAVPAPPSSPPAPPANTPSVVKVTGGQGNWGLTVNGSPYYVKGATYGPSNADAGYYLPDLASMGVNTVRTWGTDSTTETLLDAADANGIKVINGFWLSQSEDYVNDTTDETNDLNTIVGLVNQYKNNGGVLMWDVGNEVINSLSSTYSGTQLQAERVAYAQYVDRVVDAIHAADPNHPVTSTDAWVGAWPYYQQYTPDLDLMAVNSYGAACGVQSAWQSGGYAKPYILTEAGPSGEWEVPDDENGVPQEDTDQQSTQGYATDWNCVTAAKGVALGATLFNYGVENDFGGIWFNFLTGDWRRDAYYEVGSLYGGKYTSDQAPVITAMTVSDPTAVAAGKTFTVNVSASSPIGAPLRYSADLCSKYIDGGTAQQGATFSATPGGALTITAPNRIGVWKVDVYVYDDQGDAAIQTASINVVPPTPAGTNVALGKTTTASSYQATGTGAPFPPGDATDGNLATRWASDWSDPQWIEVDLGQTYTISHIQLVWETAYGQAYQIQTSNDGQNWTTVYSTTTGVGGVDDFNVSGSGRYVRMYGTARGTTFGYSLFEFGVYTAS